MKPSNKKKVITLSSSEKFKIVSSFNPSGDQPNAIKTLVNNINEGEN